MFFRYYSTSSAFEREECLQCHLLPSCRQSCIQKIMEREKFVCRKKDVERFNYLIKPITQKEYLAGIWDELPFALYGLFFLSAA